MKPVPTSEIGENGGGARGHLHEAWDQLAIAGPVVVNMVAYRLPWMITIMFVGRMGELELASAAMSTTLANVTGMSVMVGLGSAQATLSAQAFGAGSHRAVGELLQRTLQLVIVAARVNRVSSVRRLLPLGRGAEEVSQQRPRESLRQ